MSRQAAACRQSTLNPVLCHPAWAKSCRMLWSSSPSPVHDMSTDNSPVSLPISLSLSVCVCVCVSVCVSVCVHRISSIPLGLNDIPAHSVWLGPAQPSSGCRGTQKAWSPSVIPPPPKTTRRQKRCAPEQWGKHSSYQNRQLSWRKGWTQECFQHFFLLSSNMLNFIPPCRHAYMACSSHSHHIFNTVVQFIWSRIDEVHFFK